MKAKLFTVILSALALAVLGGFTLEDSGAREHYAGLLREMQLPADVGGPPHGGNQPPMDPLTLRGGATVGESEKEPLDDFVIGEITQGREAGEPA